RVAQLSSHSTLSLAFSPDGRLLAWAEELRSGQRIWNRLQLWDLEKAQAYPVPPDAFPSRFRHGLEFTHGRELLLNNGSVHELWNLATGKKVLELQGTKFTGGDPECASRGSTLLADCPWLGEGALTPRVCDLQSQRILFHLPQERAAPSCFAWSTNQELLA